MTDTWLEEARTTYEALMGQMAEVEQRIEGLEAELIRAQAEQRRLAKAADAVQPLAGAAHIVEELHPEATTA